MILAISELVREVSVAAKKYHQKSFSSDDCPKNLKESDQQTARKKNLLLKYCVQKYFGFQKLDVGRRKNKHNFEIAQLKTRLRIEALCPFLERYLENKTINYTNITI